MSPRIRNLLDRIGTTGSFLCAVHCALMPLLLALLPTLGLSAWLGHDFDAVMVLLVTILGLFSLIWGYRRHHTFHALSILILGLLILWVNVLYEPLHEAIWAHAILMTIGGLLVAIAHIVNLRLNHMHVHNANCAH